MTTDEREAMYTAFCLCCTLSERMKDCPRCVFNVGLIFKALRAIKAAERVDYPENLRDARIKATIKKEFSNVNRT